MNSFFAGNRQVMDTISGSKMVFLRSQFALLAVFLGMVYACIVIITRDYQFLKWHALLITGGATAFYLNRKGQYIASTLVLFVLTNAFVYLFTAVGRPQDGMFFYYFITNTLCIILVGYRYHLLIIALVLITLMLAVLAYLHPVQVISVPNDLTEKHERVIFLINLSISLLFGAYVILSLMRENTLVEDQLIRSHSELSKINEELDRFVYSASHDMRAPLSSLLGLISVAEKTESPEEMRLCLNMMRERVNVMDGFIKEITDYSRNARTDVEHKTVNVRETVDGILNNLKFMFEQDRIAISVLIPPDTTVVTDETRFKVVLNNLISNAFKYYDPEKLKPFIIIRAGNTEQHFFLSVEDNGLGIGAEHIDRVFGMFYRATTTREGSGLGLYIVNETIQKLEGSISVESTEKAGSIFTVKLPVKG